jgi:hypothetical protein
MTVLTLRIQGPWVKDAGETGAGLGGALVHTLAQRLQPEQLGVDQLIQQITLHCNPFRLN